MLVYKLTGKMLDMLAGGRAARQTTVPLTPRERQTLQMLAEGNSSKTIAVKLGVTIRSVANYRKSLMEKHHVHSVAELTKIAVREGVAPV